MDGAAPANTARGWEVACALTAHFLDRDTLTMGANTPAQDAALAALLCTLLPDEGRQHAGSKERGR